MPHHQLSELERHVIYHMHQRQATPAAIARRLGRHRGTIGRELNRNRRTRGEPYLPDTAQRLAEQRRDQANRRYKLDTHVPLSEYVREKLREHWSPQQIAGRLKREHPDLAAWHISHETIYRWVYRHAHHRQAWHKQLRRRRPRRKRRIPGRGKDMRGRIPGRVGIEQRPGEVDSRQRFGDWESDTMEGAKGKGLLATHVERKSRYTVIRKLKDKRADTFVRATRAGLAHLPAELCRTMTADNGKEFASFKQIQKHLGMRVYFADPHSPWQRGTNENTNGLLRDFFPKGMDLSRVSPGRIAKVQQMLNNRPRKGLNYQTPAEVLSTIPGVALRN